MSSAGMSSKILGLKFMQRQAQKQHPKPSASSSLMPPQQQAQPVADATATPSTLPAVNSPPADVRVFTDDTKPEPSVPVAVLRFKPGRRSFGSFNPRLEKKLGEISQDKVAAAAQLAAEAAEAEAARQRELEHATLMAKADAHEAAERRDAVSDDEMALHYAKYAKYLPTKKPPAASHSNMNLPPKKPSAAVSGSLGPPVAVNAVQVRDRPAGTGGKRKR